MAHRSRNQTPWRGGVHNQSLLPIRGISSRKTHSNQSSRPCNFFFGTGTCRFGDGCKYSHSATAAGADHGFKNGQATSRRVTTFEDGDDDRTDYLAWKRLLWQYPSALEGAATLAEFWTKALAVLNGEGRNSQQQLVRDLIDDDLDGRGRETHGITYIHRTLAVRLAPAGAAARGPALDMVECFLHAIIHPALLDSLSIDSYVGTLYNVVSGAGGERAVPFLLAVARALGEMRDQEDGSILGDYMRLDGLLHSMLVATHQLLCRARRACFHEDLPKLLAGLEEAFDLLDLTPCNNSNWVTLSQRARLDVLKRITGLSEGILTKPDDGGDGKAAKTAVASVYPIDLPLPGGRHDNDHAQISKIAIIPTPAEISSDQAEYLPSTDCRQPHFLADPVQRYVDTHFRLLRHDIFGPLKAALAPLVTAFRNGTAPSKLPAASRDVNAHVYQGASVGHVSVDQKRGFEVHVSFNLPAHLHQKGRDESARWWQGSKRLESGSLICLLCADEDGDATPLLLVVGDKGSDGPLVKANPKNPRMGTVLTKLARHSRDDLVHLVVAYLTKRRGVLVELPGLIPATFAPVLQNLQAMLDAGEVPLERWIVPDPAKLAAGGHTPACPDPPRYALRPGFAFSLDSITGDKEKGLEVTAATSPDDNDFLARVEANTGLDEGQARALVCALTREYALIQGPPGTGKSYLGVKLIQVLLDARRKAHLGPIVVICYTNHALDQFLMHLIAVGVTKIIRVGGQSCAAELEHHNLKVVREQTERTKHEGYILGSTYSELDEERRRTGFRLATLHKMYKGEHWAAMTRYLERKHPRIHDQIFHEEEEGWNVVGTNQLELWVGREDSSAGDATSQPQQDADALTAKARLDAHSLSPSERRLLANHWYRAVVSEESDGLFNSIDAAEGLRAVVNGVHNECNKRALSTAEIIGITTTGLARDIATLRKLRAKIVLCEEAAEVLEAHVTSALMPGVEHFIQIGDHRQLRPQINNHDLSLETARGRAFQLDRSQFERLAEGAPGVPKMPVAQLNVQRRMRPSIAGLIRETVYPDLRDHASVEALPDVVGMRENVFWLDHGHAEDTAPDNGRLKSHSNEWEVGMTMALVRHIVRQGTYKSTEIAVLTPYTGQLQKLRTALGAEFEICLNDRDEEVLAHNAGENTDFSADSAKPTANGKLQKQRLSESLRLATIDNFQGEEAAVVIVSLVRSNPSRRPGFLRTPNRINVLLSRAQHGMYLLGDSATYASVPMWAAVHARLASVGAVGDAFGLCCPRHRDTPIACREPDDFARLSPEGGCSRPCDERLERCGHRCQAKCHSAAMHDAFACPQACPRVRLTCAHRCPRLCGERCGDCVVKLDGVALPCGHAKDGVRCFERLKMDEIRCEVTVQRTMPRCGHKVSVGCQENVAADGFRCPTPCDELLECGHICPGTCGTCNAKAANGTVTHAACRKLCDRPRNTCAHVCAQRCHDGDACPPCDSPCEVRCAHSRCALPCSAPCAPCIERCAWQCPHRGRCSMPCAGPCDRLPCDERCGETLGCGHRCPGLCGEPCPGREYCHECGVKADARVDLLEMKSYNEIDPDETPVVVLGCGHVYTAESLDGLARLGDVYASDPRTGDFTATAEPAELLPVPACPDCKRPVRQFATQRYNRVVNAAVMDEAARRFLVKGQTDLAALERRIDEAEAALAKGREEGKAKPTFFDLLNETEEAAPNDTAWHRKSAARKDAERRHAQLRKLEREADQFCKDVGAEQQPAKKLSDAVHAARAKMPPNHDDDDDDDNAGGGGAPVLEMRVALGGRLAKARVQAAILADTARALGRADGEGVAAATTTTTTGAAVAAAGLYRAADALLADCGALAAAAAAHGLPRPSILGALVCARLATHLRACGPLCADDAGRERVGGCVAAAEALLDAAEALAEAPFEGAARLGNDVRKARELLGRSTGYEPVSDEEMAAIRVAMVSGAGGFSAHSGHWYKCPNGHVFAIGECGMPMELARCYECGARIGGQDHALAPGISRAREME